MKRIALILSVATTAAGFFFSTTRDSRVAAQSQTPTPLSAATQPAAKPTPPVMDDENTIIKVETELVNVSVRVIDRNNRPINNIQQREFTVFEDGVPQKIDFFSRAEVPANYALVVDNSGSMRQQLDKVIEAGKVFINSNRPDDETMIVRFVGRDKIEIEQQFTARKPDLIDAMDNLFIEGGQTAVVDAVYLSVENVDEYEKSNKSADRKRRALVLVTDGEDRNSYYSEKQLMELLRESEVQIFVIGFVDELSKDGGFIAKSPREKAKGLLERIAAESGGKAYFPSSPAELPNLAREISNEMRTQYSIGYIPSNDRKDGTYRAIKVEVADGPSQQKRIARTRAGRTAETEGPSAVKPTPAKSPK